MKIKNRGDLEDKEIYCVSCREAFNVTNCENEENLTEEEIVKLVGDANKCKSEKVLINLKNIGYGVATNIRFYSLVSNKIIGQVTGGSRNFPTREMANGGDDDFHFSFSCYYIGEDPLGEFNSDGIQFLLLYSDLNENICKMYIGISFYAKHPLDYTFYQ